MFSKIVNLLKKRNKNIDNSTAHVLSVRKNNISNIVSPTSLAPFSITSKHTDKRKEKD